MAVPDAGRSFELRPIGHVESSLADLAEAPRQADEGAPEAWLVLDEAFVEGLDGIDAGEALILLTWLDRASREVLTVHPRGELALPPQGVFSTRAPHRPNPIGLHQVLVLEIAGNRLRVDRLEAIDGTPILDLKPVLSPVIEER